MSESDAAVVTEAPPLSACGLNPEASGIACGFNQLQASKRGLLLYPRFDTGIGAALSFHGEYAENDFSILSQLVNPGDTVVELGAKFGAYSLFFAQQVGPSGAVMAWEGQRILFQSLCANMALNGVSQAHCCPWVPGAHTGKMRFPFIDYYQAQDFSRIEPSEAGEGEEVQQVALDDLQLAQCDLIRLSAGMHTVDALQGMEKTIGRLQPVLYLDWSGQDRKLGLAYSIIRSFGYALYWSIAPLSHAVSDEQDLASRVLVNALCVPEKSNFSLQGFTPIGQSTDDWLDIVQES